MTGLSKRQMRLRFGFNPRLVETLLATGVLRLLPGGSPLRQRIDSESLGDLVEGAHFVVCRECGGRVAILTMKHLRSCCALTTQQYQERHPDALLVSSLCSTNKVKTREQRKAQSEKLKKRFQTPDGGFTREQIRVASVRVQASGYKEQAATHLRALNSLPETKAARGAETKQRWETGNLRDVVQTWHREHRQESLIGAAYARRFIRRKRTKLHMRLKEALVVAGICSETEFEVGYYSIDEAIPDLQISIEADGCYWHGCSVCGFPPQPNIQKYDRAKETYLTRRGWTIVHLPGHEILHNLEQCVTKVQEAVLARRMYEVAHA